MDYTLAYDADGHTVVTRLAGGAMGSGALADCHLTYDKLDPSGVVAADVVGTATPGGAYKLVAAWDAIELVALAAVDAWLLIQRPIWALLSLLGRLYLGFWKLVWDAVQPVVGLVWGLWSWLFRSMWDLATLLWDGLRSGWTQLVDGLAALWTQWGDIVVGVVRWVAARALELLTAPLRAGLAFAELVPADVAPHLAELVGKVQGGLEASVTGVEGAAPASTEAEAMEGAVRNSLGWAIPAGAPAPAPLAESSGRLAGAISSREKTRQVSAPLTVTYQPQITVSDEGGADKAGMQAALKQGQDDLLERLKAAQEQQRRLSYG